MDHSTSAVSLATLACEVIKAIYVACEAWKDPPPNQMRDLCNELVTLQNVLLKLSSAIQFEAVEREKSRYLSRKSREMMRMTEELLSHLLERFTEPAQGWRGIAKQRLSRIFNRRSIEHSKETLTSRRHFFDLTLDDANPAKINTLYSDISMSRIPNNLPKRERMQSWLETYDPQLNHAKFLASHNTKTGAWFVNNGELTEWLQADNGVKKFLWLQGKSGSGKSCLVAHATNKIADRWEEFEDRAVLYFHCNIQDSALRSLLGSLIVQMCHTYTAKVSKSNLWLRVESVFGGLEGRSAISDERLKTLFRDVSKNFAQIVIFLDAPNEASDCSSLIDTLATEAQQHSRMQICVSSTPDLRIETILETYELGFRLVELDKHVQTHDMKIYVEDQLKTNPTLSPLEEKLKNYITEEIVEKSEGSFRYADRHLNELTKKPVLHMFEQFYTRP